MWQLESLHRLKHHKNIVAVFEHLFGEACLVHPLLVARNIFPQTESFDFTTGAHQDRIHIGGGTSYACWVPLGDLGELVEFVRRERFLPSVAVSPFVNRLIALASQTLSGHTLS
jgi:hypothetical protein